MDRGGLFFVVITPWNLVCACRTRPRARSTHKRTHDAPTCVDLSRVRSVACGAICAVRYPARSAMRYFFVRKNVLSDRGTNNPSRRRFRWERNLETRVIQSAWVISRMSVNLLHFPVQRGSYGAKDTEYDLHGGARYTQTKDQYVPLKDPSPGVALPQVSKVGDVAAPPGALRSKSPHDPAPIAATSRL